VNVLRAAVCLAIIFLAGLLSFFLPTCHADDVANRPAPFSLPCPDAGRCGNTAGSWVPAWQLRELATDQTVCDALSQDRALADEQVIALRRALAAAEQRDDALKAQLLEVAARDAREAEKKAQNERKLQRRTRWAVASTILVGAVIGGAVAALVATR